MTEKELEIIETMERYGGSFIKALAVCFQHADSSNFAKLKGTFAEYWIQYKKMTEEKK